MKRKKVRILEYYIVNFMNMKIFEPRHEKTNVLRMRKQRRRLAYREADQRLCFRCLDSTIPLLSKSEISSL